MQNNNTKTEKKERSDKQECEKKECDKRECDRKHENKTEAERRECEKKECDKKMGMEKHGKLGDGCASCEPSENCEPCAPKAEEYHVLVKNISPSATEKTLHDFFSFCGNIVSLKITPCTCDHGATNTAIVTFSDLGAVQTSLLLTNAMIVDRPITVEVHGDSSASDNYLEPEGSASKTSVMAKMFASGYMLSDEVKAKARAFDESHNIALKMNVAKELAKVKLNQIDQTLHISETAAKVGHAAKEQLNKADETLHISETAAKAAQKMQDLGHAAMQNSVVAAGVNYVQQAGQAISGKVEEVKKETKEVVEEKRKERDMNGGNPYPPPANAAHPAPAYTNSNNAPYVN